jgi:IS30 family transposase
MKRLTKQQIRTIRSLAGSGVSTDKIASTYNVTPQTIYYHTGKKATGKRKPSVTKARANKTVATPAVTSTPVTQPTTDYKAKYYALVLKLIESGHIKIDI